MCNISTRNKLGANLTAVKTVQEEHQAVQITWSGRAGGQMQMAGYNT